MKTAIVLLSGGIDSTVALAEAHSRYGAEALLTLAFAYRQRHGRELDAARKIAHYYGVDHVEAEDYFLPDYCRSGALMDRSLPLPDAAPDDPAQVVTLVPFRNGMFLARAVALAQCRGAGEVWIGCNADDAAVYPDCREAFLQAFDRLAALVTAPRVGIVAPHIRRTKAQVIEMGQRMGVPLWMTWSCYESGNAPCGKCGACRARKPTDAPSCPS